MYTGYNFNPAGFLAPTIGQSTNGHACVNTDGCEHFGFSVSGAPPTTARYYWLDSVPNAAAVPEPSIAILALFSTVICMAIRRR